MRRTSAMSITASPASARGRVASANASAVGPVRCDRDCARHEPVVEVIASCVSVWPLAAALSPAFSAGRIGRSPVYPRATRAMSLATHFTGLARAQPYEAAHGRFLSDPRPRREAFLHSGGSSEASEHSQRIYHCGERHWKAQNPEQDQSARAGRNAVFLLRSGMHIDVPFIRVRLPSVSAFCALLRSPSLFATERIQTNCSTSRDAATTATCRAVRISRRISIVCLK
jgi:hypothetical protein